MPPSQNQPPSEGSDVQGGSGKNIILVPDAEGLYKSRHNQVVFTIERKDDKLVARGRFPITAISATSFRLTPDGTTFELETDASGKVTAMRAMSTGYQTDIFDKVEPSNPAKAEMQAMTGDYVSDEAETTLKVVFTPNGLEIHQRPDTVYALKPTYADGFECKLGSIRFLRDTSGHITGMSLGDSRIWDLRLKKMEAKCCSTSQ
jgi:hypothetical protein